MRIALIAREFPPAVGGMQVVAERIARGLARTDEVTVFTTSSGSTGEVPFEQVGLLEGVPGIDAERLQGRQFDVWLATNASYAAIAGSLQGRVCVYCHGNDFLDPLPVREPWWDGALRHTPFAWRLRRGMRRATVGERRRALRQGLRQVQRVIANSTSTARLFATLYGRRPCVVCPGVDERFFSTEPKPRNGTSGSMRLLSVSRLCKSNRRKNIEGVLQALRYLSDIPELSYTVVGDGDDRPRLERLARELGVGQRVRFTGAISSSLLQREYQQADLFVLASKADKHDVEGFGIVYLEASASGTPVLCSREGGATDAVADGVNGVLIERSDAVSIASGIRRAFHERATLTSEAAVAFAEQYRWARVVSRVRTHLADVAGAASSRVPGSRVSGSTSRAGLHVGNE